ncbi:hypothetical protein QO001_005699 [Methylobacterium brachiatum]|uniref:Uncharacterized protein n=1 Tax=Methylobacterium brachiatum TaxID=269660 RepID=A0AAJ1WYR0_9HYPH|nr:hypothetical protein [Methylobacterium brachiatum]
MLGQARRLTPKMGDIQRGALVTVVTSVTLELPMGPQHIADDLEASPLRR